MRTDCEDEVVSSIHASSGSDSVVIGTFRQFASCPVYVFADNKVVRKLEHNFPIADVAVCPADPNILVTVSDFIRVWNKETGDLIAVLAPHESSPDLCPFTAVKFAPNSTLFAVTDVRGVCSVFDARKLDLPIEVFEIGTERLYGLTFVSAEVVACVGESGSLYVLDRLSHQVLCSRGVDVQPQCQPTKLAWLPGLSLVAVANQASGIFSVFELSSMGAPPRLVGSSKPSESIADMAWIPSHPQYLVVARDSGLIEVWNKNNLHSPHFSENIAQSVSAVACVDSGVLVGTAKGQVLSTPLPGGLDQSPIAPFLHQASYPALA